MSIEPKVLQKLAALSRLSFSPEDLARFSAEFGSILQFVDKIQGADTKGVQPLTTTADATGTPERSDAVTAVDARTEYQKSAPAVEQGFYVVPKIVE